MLLAMSAKELEANVNGAAYWIAGHRYCAYRAKADRDAGDVTGARWWAWRARMDLASYLRSMGMDVPEATFSAFARKRGNTR